MIVGIFPFRMSLLMHAAICLVMAISSKSKGDNLKKLILLPALVLATQAHAQQTAPAPALAPAAPTVVEPAAPSNILRAGTEIPLLVREELTTREKKLRVGQRFQMEVASNVEANGVLVVPAGTPAVGEITEVRNKGMWGKSGYINARIISMRVGDRNIRLTGTFDDKGVTGTGGVVAAIAFVPIAGFFTTGTSALIPSGAGVKGFLDEDIAYRAVAAAPKVIDAPAVQPAAAPAAAPAPAQPAAH